CARATIGHAAALPSPAMNCRRLIIRLPRLRAAELTAAPSDQGPWRSLDSRPSRILSETAPGDRPASRRVECDPHRRPHDERGLPGGLRRRAARRLWQSKIAYRLPVRWFGTPPI